MYTICANLAYFDMIKKQHINILSSETIDPIEIKLDKAGFWDVLF